MKLYIRTGTGSVTFWYQEGPGGAFDSTLSKHVLEWIVKLSNQRP